MTNPNFKPSGEKLSGCCGAPDKRLDGSDANYADFGLCSDCKDHCDYVDVCYECGEIEPECACPMSAYAQLGKLPTFGEIATVSLVLIMFFVAIAVGGGN